MGRDNRLTIRYRKYCYDQVEALHYDSGNRYLTAEWNALAMVIPRGERYFVHSVKSLAHLSRNPLLKAQIKDFIGQENMHSHEVDRSLGPLKDTGFPVKVFYKWYDKFLSPVEKWGFLKKLNLAATAAGEHYTAVLSLWHLENGYAKRFPESVRNVVQWHGAEELEHRAVAFDLLQEVSPKNYLLRLLGFFIGLGSIWVAYRKALRMLLKWQGLTRKEIRAERKKGLQIRIPLLSWRFPKMWEYLRPGFHPHHIDDHGLGQQILAMQEKFSVSN